MSVSDEDGFQVAAAWVSVTPDASDFAQQLDEEIGGLQVAVRVVPDASDFQGLVDELDLTVSVRLVANTADLDDQINEAVSGHSATISVGADTAPAQAEVREVTDEIGSSRTDFMVGADTGAAQEQAQAFAEGVSRMSSDIGLGVDSSDLGGILAGGLGGGVARVSVVPDVPGDFDEQVSEKIGTIVVHAQIVPDTAGLGERLEDSLGGSGDADISQPGETRPYSGTMPAASQAAADELNGIASRSAETAAAVEADFGDITAAAQASAAAQTDAQAGALYSWIDDLDRWRERATMGLESWRSTVANMAAEPPTAEWAADAEATMGSLDSLSARLANSDQDMDTLNYLISDAGTSFGELQGDVAAVAEELGGVRDELIQTINQAKGLQEQFAAAKAEGAGMGAGIAAGAGEAEEAAGGLAGVFGTLGERMAYMAVDPFMWMMVGTTAIPELTKAWDALNEAMEQTDEEIAKQTGASGFNVEGYQKAAEQLQHLADSVQMQPGILGQLEESFTGGPVGMQSRTQQAADSAATMAANLGSKLDELSGRYDLTARQAEALATAAGVSAKQLGASGAAGDAAAAKIEAYANANIGATGPVGELSGDMMTFSNDALTAASRVTALDDAYGLLVGNFVSSQQAALGVSQDFLTIKSNAEQAGASMRGANSASLTLQQSFFELPSAIEQTANAMIKEGDSTREVTTYVGEQISKLSGLTGGSSEARQAVEGLKEWEDNLTSSTKSFNDAAEQAANTVASQFTAQVKQAGDTSNSTSGLVNTLKTAILNTGTTSEETAGARQELIADLEHAGIKASVAKADVAAFIAKIAAIPSNTNWTLTEHATGTWSEQQIGSAINVPGSGVGSGGLGVVARAGGGMVLGGSGSPKADDIMARLSSGEYVVQADAVGKYGSGMLDSINAKRFGDGGLAGSYSGSASGLGSWNQAQYYASENAVASALMGSADAGGQAAMQAAAAQAIAAGGSSTRSGNTVNIYFTGMAYPTAEQIANLKSELAYALVGAP